MAQQAGYSEKNSRRSGKKQDEHCIFESDEEISVMRSYPRPPP